MSARFHLRFRYFEMVKYPDERIYTFWDYFRDHYGRDRGLRIDHCSSVPRSRRGLQWFSLRFC